MSPRFSVVIPAYNEERLLGRLLDSLDLARATCVGAGAIEVIVADNGSTDDTARLAEARGCRVVRVEKRVIAAVRNGGARAAGGEILAFIDADSQVHARTFLEIDRALATGRVVGGATGVTLERWSPGIAVTWAMMVSLVLVTGMDTGVVFCRRQDFERVGGYNEALPVAEDVAFLQALRRLGATRGQGLARVTQAKAVASTRKFDQFGDWHFFPLAAHGLWSMLKGDVTGFADRYWYKSGR